ncbi:MAG: hypothetical protein ABI475_00590 [Methylophilaceae bacterium]
MEAKIIFDELSTKGIADDHRINFSHIEGKLYGGDLKAQMAIHWPGQWSAMGNLERWQINLIEIMLEFSGGIT